jgi:medium-chain acyl-[acyl-carrier-protein] hydrolase
MSPRYWIFPQPSPQAKLILLAAPYAGGGASVFHTWPSDLPGIELAALRLPGREQLLSEPPLRCLSDVVDAVVPEAAGFLDRTYVLFGHSLGALIAFQIARELRRRYAAPPALLMVSACQAPQVLRLRRTFDLPDRELVRTLSDPHRAPVTEGSSFAESPELVELMLPTIRADLEVAQTYEFQPESPLPCPIVAFCGTRGDEVLPSQMQPWADQAAGGFRLHLIDGGHLFLIDRRPQLLELIRDELSQLH